VAEEGAAAVAEEGARRWDAPAALGGGGRGAGRWDAPGRVCLGAVGNGD
jgi:hypothetical protein